jgi:galactonate dehydratase
MKITDIETFVIHPPRGKNMLFVKLTTDNGIVGWGEAYTQADRDTAAIAHIE